MLTILFFFLSNTFSASLCTVKVELETFKAKQITQQYKYPQLSAKQCKQKAMYSQNKTVAANIRYKFVSWKWHNKTTKRRL